MTFGLGPGLFGSHEYGLAPLSGRAPGPLRVLPKFDGDALNPAWCGGDLVVQACSNDPQVAFHAAHSLIRVGKPDAVARWSTAGFGRTRNSRRQATPRNLLGFKDGTNNIMGEDARALDKHVWVRAPESPEWMHGGTYLVVRRVRMQIGGWDELALADQERVFGRRKASGAPLTGRAEADVADLDARVGGEHVIPADAHSRLASPEENSGRRILRRGYSYLDGLDPATGAPSGGQLFMCFQRDPGEQFVPIQRRLSRNDALRQHTQHVGSAVFACPPGATPGGFVGETLFA